MEVHRPALNTGVRESVGERYLNIPLGMKAIGEPLGCGPSAKRGSSPAIPSCYTAEMSNDHKHVQFLPDGRRAKFRWTENSTLVINGQQLTALDCEDSDCPYVVHSGDDHVETVPFRPR